MACRSRESGEAVHTLAAILTSLLLGAHGDLAEPHLA
jgi:hypothetical protein